MDIYMKTLPDEPEWLTKRRNQQTVTMMITLVGIAVCLVAMIGGLIFGIGVTPP